MSGTCQGTINITIPCTPNWTGGAWSACQSNDTQTRTETDGCGNTRTATQACTYVPAYREANLIECSVTPTTLTPGNLFTLTMNISEGSVTESYRVLMLGGIEGTTNIVVTAGIATKFYPVTFAVPTTATGGAKNFTVTLTKI